MASGKHAFRGALTAWMTLIVLHTVGTSGGSSKLTGLFTDVDNLVKRALSPNVAAIPDRRAGAAADDPQKAAAVLARARENTGGPGRFAV